MNKKIADALEFIKATRQTGVILAIPFVIGARDTSELRNNPLCKGMVLRNPAPDITASSSSTWLGCFEDQGWRLPTVRAPIVFVGSQFMLTRQMAAQIFRSRRLFIFCKINGSYQKLAMHRFLLWRLGEKLLNRIAQLPEGHVLRRVATITKQVPLLRRVWRQTFKREGFVSAELGARHTKISGLAEEALYKQLLQRARESATSTGYEPIPRRVLLINAGLAAGGAERQIVNTLIGLKASGQCESARLLAEYMEHAPSLEFFLHELEAGGVEVSQIEHAKSLAEDGLSSVSPEVAEVLADIEPSLIEEILNLVEEFRSRRPEVVHAWQDSTSIKSGIAAVIAGVPRIVLASRNVTPTNFSYYRDYMYFAYRALASLDCVIFLNNSEAGAMDYTRWLGLPKDRFAVVRNGVELGYLKRSASQDMREYRRSLGIPENCLVVGSVFRFWEEKRPMLWLQAAALVAKVEPDVHFLLIGEGPMRPEMELFINNSDLHERVHLPGARPDVATPLSAMDVFVMASEFEGTPNVILEAQWLGLPIVSTDAGGACEAFEPGVTGLLASNATAEEIASLVMEYLTDQARRLESGRCGQTVVATKFSVDRMIRATLNLYGFASMSPMNTGVAPALQDLEDVRADA